MNRASAVAALALAVSFSAGRACAGITAYACDVYTQAKGPATKPATRFSYFFSPDFENSVLMTGYVFDRVMLNLRVTASGELAGEALDQKTGRRTAVSGPASETRFETERFRVRVVCGASVEASYALRSTEGFVYLAGHAKQNFDLEVDRSIAMHRHCYLGDAQAAARDLGVRFGLPTQAKQDGRVEWTYQEVRWSDSECPPDWDRCRYFGTPTYIPRQASIEACR